MTCAISPLKLDETYAQLTMEAALNRIPVVVPAEPLCGATSPITLAGNLVVQNVDSLAGVMLAQLTSPGTPTLYGCVSSTTDLRDLKYLSGAVEMGLINAAAAQMAQFYQLPIYVTAGMSDSKVNDAQAGYESAITSLLVALAGGNYIHDAAGMLENCLLSSFEQYVIDNEMLGMVARILEGIRVTPETLSFDAIKQVGPKGNFLGLRHTLDHILPEHYIPGLFDRSTLETWEANGSKDIREVAREKAREILATHTPEPLPPEIEAELDGILKEAEETYGR